jgi:hypothetical protein
MRCGATSSESCCFRFRQERHRHRHPMIFIPGWSFDFDLRKNVY